MAKMGVESLKANLSNPGRVYLWDVLIGSPIGGGDTETIALRCQTVSIPNKTFEPISVNYKQTAGVKFHGRLRFDQTWDLTFIEGEDKAIFKTLYDWCQKIVNDRDGVGDPDPDIKTDIILKMITTKGDDWLVIKLIGCMPQTIAPVALSYDTNEVVKFTVTMSYDRWEEQA